MQVTDLSGWLAILVISFVIFPFNIMPFVMVYEAIVKARNKRLKAEWDARYPKRGTGVVLE